MSSKTNFLRYWRTMRKYPFQRQHDTIDCGPSCLKMLSSFYGKKYSLDFFRELCYLNREGVSIVNIEDTAKKIGFTTLITSLSLENLIKDCPMPCILHWNQDHFVVLYEIKEKKSGILNQKIKEYTFVIADPAHGIVEIDLQTFLSYWISFPEDKGIGLFLEPNADFHTIEPPGESARGFFFLVKYLVPYKRYIFQLVIGMTAASIFSLLFPFLTQLLIDVGLANRDFSIIYLIFASQLFLFIGTIAIDLIRGWLLLHINTRISLSIISDFLIKLLKLPMRYFDSKAVGDLTQRIQDHHQIESFLTGSFLMSVFSVINMIVFLIVLAFYNKLILLTFVLMSSLALLWVFLFQKKRENLNYKLFARNRENQDKIYEMIIGMQEIKLFGAENQIRWNWEKLQVKYFKLNIETLTLEQFQQTGYRFLNHLKNILISFMTIYEVINNNLTLGSLLSISYIIGQTNGPIDQLVGLIKGGQDAKLSMDRLQEIHNKKEEESNDLITDSSTIHSADIVLDGVSFQYDGPHSPFVLKNINLKIPKGKVTAIVGSSGSGKTTLMKLLLNFYSPTQGQINLGTTSLEKLSPTIWRGMCGTVMQDGFIFFDSIEKNITLGNDKVDKEKLKQAIKIANLTDFIENLPLKQATKIGSSGIGISGGQKQRIFIARAVYKNPDFIFFDEATSSLDANNEKIIVDNLNQFYDGRTVVVIAHRLSTVKNADQIIMLENGEIIESGDHKTLCSIKGKYFELVKNQLDVD